MRSRLRKIGFALAGTMLVLGIALWLAVLKPHRFTPPPLPVPNGYDDFVRAGQLLVGNPDKYEEASLGELQSLVESNAPAFAALEEGLTKESRVPLQFNKGEVNRWLTEFNQFKQLAKAKRAETRLDLMKNHPEDAANDCVQIIRFGEESCRGGVIIHHLVGIAIKGIGTQQLQEIYPVLDAAQCKRLAKSLENVQDSREPLAEVAKTEEARSRRIVSSVERIKWMITTHSLNQSWKSTQATFSRIKQYESKLNHLLLAIASRAYELEQEHAPASAADLVPEYLNAVPLDLVTGKPIALQPASSNTP